MFKGIKISLALTAVCFLVWEPAGSQTKVVNMVNAMYFIGHNNSGCAQYWWIRQGTSDNHTSQTVIVNLATSLENRNKVVNTFLYWDAGHGADQDPEDFIAWIGRLCSE
jgi:hypothetical protein